MRAFSALIFSSTLLSSRSYRSSMRVSPFGAFLKVSGGRFKNGWLQSICISPCSLVGRARGCYRSFARAEETTRSAVRVCPGAFFFTLSL